MTIILQLFFGSIIKTISNNYYLFIYLQRLHPAIEKSIKQVKDKSLSESNSQLEDNNNKLQNKKSLWTVHKKNEQENKKKEKVCLNILISNIYIFTYNL